MRQTGHAGLDEYLARNRLTGGDPRTDGAVVLVFDDRYRVYCRPAQHGDLVFEIRVTEMPDEERRSDDLLYEALQFTGERLGEADEVPVLSDDARTLLLQQRVAAGALIDDFEHALESFLNAIGTWRRRLRVL